MAVIAGPHAVENHFGDGLLALHAFAARFVIHHFRQAAMLGLELVDDEAFVQRFVRRLTGRRLNGS